MNLAATVLKSGLGGSVVAELRANAPRGDRGYWVKEGRPALRLRQNRG
jgi:hypothetical protein